MKFTILMSVFILLVTSVTEAQTRKCKILVVSSYHREYLWSQDTQKGVCEGLMEFRFLDNESQAAEFTKTDYVESSSSIIKKVWMDTKRKNLKNEIYTETSEPCRPFHYTLKL